MLLPGIAGALSPAALWTFDGAAVPSRLDEAYGNTVLRAAEANGTNAWSTRSGFGEVLANGAATSYLKVTNDASLDPGNGDFSWCLWSCRTSDDTNTAGLLDALSSSATSGWQVFYQGNDTIRLRLDDDQGNTVNVDTVASHLSLNIWQHVAFTVDRTTKRARILVNGVEATAAGGVDISALTGSITPDQDLFIGTLNGNSPARGRLDDVAFFRGVLSSVDLQAMLANGGTPVLAQWPATPPSPVTIAPAGGTFHAPVSVTLSGGPAGTELRYTLDGTQPVSDSPLYSAPLAIASSAELQVRAFQSGAPVGQAAASIAVIPATAPNVVVIVGDDIGFGDLGCYGSVNVATPHLDALARSGQRFTQWTLPGPGDAATLYSALTGRQARRGGIGESLAPAAPGIDAREWTLAEAFAKQGHDTAYIGYWPLGSLPGSLPNDQGFTLFHGIRQSSATAPALMENATVLQPSSDASNLLETFTTRAEGFLDAQGNRPFLLWFQPGSLPATGTSQLGDAGNRIEALDASVGRLIAKLDSRGLTASTLVVFLSGSGADRSASVVSPGSNGQLRDGKGTTWEGGVRVPAIARWQGVIPHTINRAVLGPADLLPSLAAITGGYLAPDRILDGTDRSPVLLGAKVTPDPTAVEYVHGPASSGHPLQVVRSGPWKLHLSYLNTDAGNTVTAAAPLLYQVDQDPTEHINRAAEQPSRVAELQALAAARNATFQPTGIQLPAFRPPFLADPVSDLRAGEADRSLTYGFLRPADSTDTDYALRVSDDLASWTRLPISPFVRSRELLPGGEERISLEIPADSPLWSGPRRFFQLHAERPASP